MQSFEQKEEDICFERKIEKLKVYEIITWSQWLKFKR
jgi:CRISPR/Cas system-associated endonuclease Cas3-HD